MLSQVPPVPAVYGTHPGPQAVHRLLVRARSEGALDIVIFYVGYAPRDVFMGMSALGQSRSKAYHSAALNVTYAQLQKIAATVKHEWQLPDDNIFHKTVCIIPHRRHTDNVVIWDVDFKSRWIAKEVSRRLASAGEQGAPADLNLARHS